MDCKKAKDIILTDYLDARLEAGAKAELETHLKSCSSCREFLLNAENLAFKPFNNAIRQKAPEKLWSNIESKINSQLPEPKESFVGSLMNRIRELLHAPKPSIVFASALTMVIAAIMLSRFVSVRPAENLSNNKDERQIESLVYLMAYSDTVLNVDRGGYGSSIEEYFLQ